MDKVHDHKETAKVIQENGTLSLLALDCTAPRVGVGNLFILSHPPEELLGPKGE